MFDSVAGPRDSTCIRLLVAEGNFRYPCIRLGRIQQAHHAIAFVRRYHPFTAIGVSVGCMPARIFVASLAPWRSPDASISPLVPQKMAAMNPLNASSHRRISAV